MFDTLDPIFLARLQFAFTVAFHFIFPSLSIGLASYLAVLNGLWLRTRDAVYLDLFKYWVKIFAIIFAMGVVSGITMSYQFGTNWAVFSDKAGPELIKHFVRLKHTLPFRLIKYDNFREMFSSCVERMANLYKQVINNEPYIIT